MFGTALNLINHILPILITLGMIVVVVTIRHITPMLHYIALVASARNDEGVTKLAKYLAHKTGGPRIHVGQTWEDFIPAANKLAEVHQERVEKIILNK